MEVITINTWDDYTNQVFDTCPKDDTGRFRSNYVFRGHSSINYQLETSLSRNKRETKLEKYIIRNFQKYIDPEFLKYCNTEWSTMALGQHHGLPTRLLDWSYSPYIALHFATEDLTKYKEDAAIYMVNFVNVNKNAPKKLANRLRKEKCYAYTLKMLEETYNSISKFERERHGPYMIFFEPPSFDSRIVNQFALFSVMSNPNCDYNEYIEKNNIDSKKLIIPQNKKKEFRDKLDQLNITERLLFPGLDGLSKWLNRYYYNFNSDTMNP
jgi:hypothetical protein